MKSQANKVHNAIARLRRAYRENYSCQETRCLVLELRDALGDQADLFFHLFARKLTNYCAWDALSIAQKSMREVQTRNMKAVKDTSSRQQSAVSTQRRMAAHA